MCVAESCVRDLRHRYDNREALGGLSLDVYRGEVMALLGPNGSGKTTLIQQLMGLRLPDEGTVTTLDRPSAELGHDELTRIGYVPQEIRLLDWMDVEEHLAYVASFLT